MVIEIQPQTERLVREEIERGHFASIDEIIVSGVRQRRSDSFPTKSRAEAVALIRSIRARDVLPPNATIRSWIDEGRD